MRDEDEADREKHSTCEATHLPLEYLRVSRFSPRPKPTPAWIASSVKCGKRSVVGLDLGLRLVLIVTLYMYNKVMPTIIMCMGKPKHTPLIKISLGPKFLSLGHFQSLEHLNIP